MASIPPPDALHGGGLLGPAPVPKTCRYHPETPLISVAEGKAFALLFPPPYYVHDAGGSPQTLQVSPYNLTVYAWYCPLCSYVELHYK